MSVTAKALREQRRALVTKARKEIFEKAEAENRPMNAEENSAWEKIMGGVRPDGTAIRGEVDLLKDRIDRLDAIETVEKEMDARRDSDDGRIGREDFRGDNGKKSFRRGGGDGAQTATPEQFNLALQAWLRVNNGHDISEEHDEACKIVGLNPNRPRLDLKLPGAKVTKKLQRIARSTHRDLAFDRMMDFQANLGTTPGTAGGYLIPPETLIKNLEVNMLWYGGMRQVAETIVTKSGERMSWPTADDTTNTGVQLGEGGAAMPPGQVSVDPTWAKVFWDAYKFSSKPILVNYELLEDAEVDLAEVLGEMMGIRLGRITNTKYTVGSGASTAKGIITAASSFSAISSTAIFPDDILGLIHSIDPAYRTNDAGFMMHDTILLTLRKLKDGMGRYLWQDGMQDGAPDRLFKYPLTINQDMDSATTSGKKTLLFGQLPKYKIRRVNKLRLYRLEERYRDTDQDGFVALVREDGNLLTAGTAPVKYLQH
jgi:HK97 family phage major capsid protein